MTSTIWVEFLERLNPLIIEYLRAQNIRVEDYASASATGSLWLGAPGATEAEIASAETRLGIRLPPSYRSFLEASNGWTDLGHPVSRLWSTDRIEWFRVRHQDWIEAYQPLPSASDDEYFVYGDDQLTGVFRPEYLSTALDISEVGDSAIYLLNPQVVDSDGEWEAMCLANYYPGVARYRSFWDLLQSVYAARSRSPWDLIQNVYRALN